MTSEGYGNLLDAQGGTCALCSFVPEEGRFLCVDHDHSCCPGKRTCGKCVRGLLCHNHNRALGLFHDNVVELTLAVAYLNREVV